MNQKRTFTCYYPLWGVGFDSEELGVVGGQVIAGKPYQDEWRKILKSDVFKEYIKYSNGKDISGANPQLCLMITRPLEGDENLGDGIHRHMGAMQNSIYDAILALRLMKPGWFHNPELNEFSFMSNEVFSRIERAPGPYRQMFMAGFDRNFPEFYQLDLKDLQTPKTKEAPSTKTWGTIEAYRNSGGNSAIEIAIENFNLSYSLNISESQKSGALFIALDAIMGGMSLRRKRGKRVLVDIEMQAGFEERLRELLELVGCQDSTAIANWMNSTMRDLRNEIAHGSTASLETRASENHQKLVALIRQILPHYMLFCTKWNAEMDLIQNRLGLPDQELSLVEAYNKALELSAIGNREAKALLVN